MELSIKISEGMDKARLENPIEDRSIRISEEVVVSLERKWGDYLGFRDKWGGLEYLVARSPLANDTEIVGYVTSQTFSRLFVRDKKSSVDVHQVNGITLGCDPEAFLINPKNELIPACRFMAKCGEVGHDGVLLEFRPPPHTNENVVTRNLFHLLQKARGMINKFPEGKSLRIMAASSVGNITAGFHLHYGLPRRLLGTGVEARTIATIMTKAFDYYIGVPSIILEGSVDSTRRTLPYVAYGKPGQYRLSGRTFEYRMPGGMNLKHPCLTRGLLALGAVVVEDLVSRICEYTDSFLNLRIMLADPDLQGIYPNLPNVETLYSIVCNPEVVFAKQHFEIIKKDVRNMVGYKNRSGSIESYFSCIDAGQIFDNNMELNWGGVNEEQQR